MIIDQSTFLLLVLAGRYKVRVVSIEMPDIHTSWHDITVGKCSRIESYLFNRPSNVVLSSVSFAPSKFY